MTSAVSNTSVRTESLNGNDGKKESLGTDTRSARSPLKAQPSAPGVPWIQTIPLFIDCPNQSIKTQNLQVNADIILEIYVSIKK